MSVESRVARETGYALVDGIPFELPVDASAARAMMAVFPVDAKSLAALLPGGGQFHPVVVMGRAFLLIAVVDYQQTDIGNYIEFNVGIACTRGSRPARSILPLLFPGHYGLGNYIIDLPVSTEISVKGGRGIWGMPKHQANLDFLVEGSRVSSQYDLDGQFAMRLDIRVPKRRLLPLKMGGISYSCFRGMLYQARVFVDGRPTVGIFGGANGILTIGDHPRLAAVKALKIPRRPVATVYYPRLKGLLDDHVESWFLRSDQPVETIPEGLEQVVGLGQGRTWLAPPDRTRGRGGTPNG